MTRSNSNTKEMYTAFDGLWKLCKKHIESPPQNVDDWVKVLDDFSDYCGRDPFRAELATSCYRQLMRMNGQKVPASINWGDK